MSKKMDQMSIDVDLSQFELDPGQALIVDIHETLAPGIRSKITEFFRQHYPNNPIIIRDRPVSVFYNGMDITQLCDGDVPGKDWSIKIDGFYEAYPK